LLLRRHDAETGVTQPLDDDPGRRLRVEDFMVEVGSAQQVDQDVERIRFVGDQAKGCVARQTLSHQQLVAAFL
jgi:hypothetical protein